MGKIETQSRERLQRNQLRKLLLESIKVAGILAVSAIAPNVVGAMAKIGIIPSGRQKDVIERTTKRLIRAGMLEWKGPHLRLTKKGERELRKLTLREMSRTQPRRWDRKWRVLIFDIPERRKGLRRQIRGMLNAIGFIRLQDSVWVYPYDCEDLVMLLKADYHIGDDMLYLLADSIERDDFLKKHFHIH